MNTKEISEKLENFLNNRGFDINHLSGKNKFDDYIEFYVKKEYQHIFFKRATNIFPQKFLPKAPVEKWALLKPLNDDEKGLVTSIIIKKDGNVYLKDKYNKFSEMILVETFLDLNCYKHEEENGKVLAICKKTYPDEDDMRSFVKGELPLQDIKIYYEGKKYWVVKDYYNKNFYKLIK